MVGSFFLCPCAVQGQTQPSTEALNRLANDFWTWRAKYAPFTAEDVNRLERSGAVRGWATDAIDKRTRDLKEFDARYHNIDLNGWPIPSERMLRSSFGPDRAREAERNFGKSRRAHHVAEN